jgi:hypothetical protein
MKNGEKTIDRRFRAALCLLAMALVLLVLNNLMYNWVFLPQYYREHPRTFFITWSQIADYFRWTPGGLITILNAILFIVSLILFGSGRGAAGRPGVKTLLDTGSK